MSELLLSLAAEALGAALAALALAAIRRFAAALMMSEGDGLALV